MKLYFKITCRVLMLAFCFGFLVPGQAAESSSVSYGEELLAAAENGDVKSQYLMGCRLYSGVDGAGIDYKPAAEWFRKAAEAGHAGAQAFLGYMYVTACGVPASTKEGMEWLKKSADQNNAQAQSFLGTFYETGRGVEPDRFEAMDWYMKAAAQGDEESKKDLERLRKGSAAASAGSNEWWMVSIEELTKKAEQGDAEAQRSLGFRYEGYGGTDIDFQKAMYWLEKAAAQTNMQARYSLSQLYVHTTNVIPEKAFYHCAIAAEGGHRLAQRVLGQYYRDGFGTNVDRAKSLYWLSQAEQAGDDRAGKSIYSLIKGRAEFSEGLMRGRQLASEDYSPPKVELYIRDLENKERTVRMLKYDPKTKQVETDYMFGSSNRLPLAAFNSDGRQIIQNELKHRTFDGEIDLQITGEDLARKDCEQLGHIGGRRGSSRFTYDGVVYRLEFKNSDRFTELQNLKIESRCYYKKVEIWMGPTGPTGKPRDTSKYEGKTYKIEKFDPASVREFKTEPLVVESYDTDGGVYIMGAPTKVESKILGIWVRASCVMADGSTIYRDFCEPASLKSKITWD